MQVSKRFQTVDCVYYPSGCFSRSSGVALNCLTLTYSLSINQDGADCS